MSRLASQAKADFYPMPMCVVSDITKMLDIRRDSEIKVLDPCCGEGNALADMKQA